jgi:hypothetical protein
VAKVARPVAATRKTYANLEPQQWVWYAYYGIAAYFILSSGVGVLMDLLSLVKTSKEASVIGDASSFTYIALVFDIVGVLFGLGLLLRVEIIRAITNFFCYIKILMGLLAILGSFGMMLAFGLIGFLVFLLSMFNVASAAFMIYLIGETDKHAPNL